MTRRLVPATATEEMPRVAFHDEIDRHEWVTVTVSGAITEDVLSALEGFVRRHRAPAAPPPGATDTRIEAQE